MLNQRNLTVILLLGFASGLPIALTASTLQAWFTVSNASLVTIATLSLLGQPYIYKFLWAPLLDRYSLTSLGRRRSWLLITQIGLCISIACMAFGDPKINPCWLAACALVIATLSATQDTAVNAYTTDILRPAEKGLGSALTVWGYRIAMLVSGGLALIFADHIGWHATYLIMAGLMLIGISTTYFAKEPVINQTQVPTQLREAIIGPLKEFFSRRSAWLILLFILFYKFGDALSVSLTTPFLIRGLGFSLTTVGVVNKAAGMAASMLGVLVAGLLMTRLSLFKSLFLFGVTQALAVILLLLLAIVGKNYWMLVFTIIFDNFFNAMGGVAFVAFLMVLCDHRYTATQFALFSAFASVGRVFTGPLAGAMAENMSWPIFFVWAFVLCIPGLMILWYLNKQSAGKIFNERLV